MVTGSAEGPESDRGYYSRDLKLFHFFLFSVFRCNFRLSCTQMSVISQ